MAGGEGDEGNASLRALGGQQKGGGGGTNGGLDKLLNLPEPEGR